jgi:catechol 2,3-dioxygenase-like lactoylglutathione lyase family enzyme
MTLKRMDNVGIVVESLDAAISFFAELGLKLEGRATIEPLLRHRRTPFHWEKSPR